MAGNAKLNLGVDKTIAPIQLITVLALTMFLSMRVYCVGKVITTATATTTANNYLIDVERCTGRTKKKKDPLKRNSEFAWMQSVRS